MKYFCDEILGLILWKTQSQSLHRECLEHSRLMMIIYFISKVCSHTYFNTFEAVWIVGCVLPTKVRMQNRFTEAMMVKPI